MNFYSMVCWQHLFLLIQITLFTLQTRRSTSHRDYVVENGRIVNMLKTVQTMFVLFLEKERKKKLQLSNCLNCFFFSFPIIQFN